MGVTNWRLFLHSNCTEYILDTKTLQPTITWDQLMKKTVGHFQKNKWLQTQHIFTIKLLPEKKYLCLTFNRQDKNKILNILQNISPLSTWFEETQTLKINLKEIRCNNGVKCLYRIISINNVANDSLFLKCYFCWLSTLVVMIWLFSCISVFWPWIGIRWINMYVRDTMQNYQWFGHI
jgi:hypothetical protein